MDDDAASGPRIKLEFEIQQPNANSSLIRTKHLEPRRGYEVRDASDPHDGKLWQIRVSHRRMDEVARRGYGQAKELAFLVPEVLESPCAIFQGVREDGEDDWLCYCGRPEYAYRGFTGQRVLAPLDEVYLVFVNSDRVAYLNRWDKADSEQRRFPVDYRIRFGKRVQ
jgi:hypothetical protein